MTDFITKALTRPRCQICDWPMAETSEQGCVPGNCSYRPGDPTEQRRIKEKSERLNGVSPVSNGECKCL